MKRCSCCKQFKSTDNFCKSKSQKDGFHNQCKDCVRDSSKRNAEKISISRKQRYQKNKEVIKEKSKIYRSNHPEVELKRSKTDRRIQWKAEYLERTKEHRSERWKRYYSLNSDRLKEVRRNWYHRNKDAASRRYKKWSIANKVNIRRRGQKRWAMKFNAIGSYTDQELMLFWNFYGNTCLCCGSIDDMTIDHVVPLSKGGTNYIWNLQPLCRSCNSKRLAVDFRTPEQIRLFNEALERQRVILAQEQAQALIDELFDK